MTNRNVNVYSLQLGYIYYEHLIPFLLVFWRPQCGGQKDMTFEFLYLRKKTFQEMNVFGPHLWVPLLIPLLIFIYKY